MPGQQTRTRNQQIVNFQANSQRTSEKLSLQYQDREWFLNLQAALDNGSNGIFTATDLVGGDAWGMIESLEVQVNGGDVVQTFTGEELFMYNAFYNNRPVQPTGIVSGASTAIIDTTLVLPFWDQRSFFPLDSMLDTARLNDLRLLVRWKDAAALGFPNAVFTTDPTITINTRECFGLVSKNPKTGQLQAPDYSLTRRVRTLNPSTIQTSDAYQIRLPVGNIYKGLLINTKDGGIDLPDCIDNFQLSVGTTVLIQGRLKALRDYQNLVNHYGSPSGKLHGVADSTGGLIKLGQSAATKDGAWTYLSFVDDGYVSEAFDTFTYGEFIVTLKTNQTIPYLAILSDQLVPIRN